MRVCMRPISSVAAPSFKLASRLPAVLVSNVLVPSLSVCLSVFSGFETRHLRTIGIERVVEIRFGNKKEYLSWRTLTYKLSWNACILCFRIFVVVVIVVVSERTLAEKSRGEIIREYLVARSPRGWWGEAYNPNERRKNVSSCKDGESVTVTETYCDKDLPPSRP